MGLTWPRAVLSSPPGVPGGLPLVGHTPGNAQHGVVSPIMGDTKATTAIRAAVVADVVVERFMACLVGTGPAKGTAPLPVYAYLDGLSSTLFNFSSVLHDVPGMHENSPHWKLTLGADDRQDPAFIGNPCRGIHVAT